MYVITDGTIAFPIGDKAGLPMVRISEYGAVVAGVFKEGGGAWAGKVVNAVSDYITGDCLYTRLADTLGRENTFEYSKEFVKTRLNTVKNSVFYRIFSQTRHI